MKERSQYHAPREPRYAESRNQHGDADDNTDIIENRRERIRDELPKRDEHTTDDRRKEEEYRGEEHDAHEELCLREFHQAKSRGEERYDSMRKKKNNERADSEYDHEPLHGGRSEFPCRRFPL